MGIFSPKISKIIGKARFESLSEVINASRFAREQIDLVQIWCLVMCSASSSSCVIPFDLPLRPFPLPLASVETATRPVEGLDGPPWDPSSMARPVASYI